MTLPSGMRARTLAAALLVCASAVAGCGGSQPGAPASGAGSAPAGADTRKLTVSAAASLVNAFGTLQDKFEAANPGVDVVLNYGGSSALAQQIVNGAPVDVFAAANTGTMDTVTKAGLSVDPKIFVTNKLQIAVAAGNPKGITGFADLAKPGLKVVVCARQVPCGSSEKLVEQASGVKVAPVSEEPDVTSVLGKVSSGDADAGVVYVTDVLSAPGKVTGVDIAQADKAINTYPIAVLKNAKDPALANKWVDFVRGPEGQQVLKAAGFGSP